MCSINPTTWASCPADALGHAAGGLASAGFDAVAAEFANGVGTMVTTLTTFWTSVPTQALSTNAGTPVGMLTAMLDWIMLVVGLVAIMLVAAHMAITGRGDALVDGGKGIARFIAVTSVQVPAVALLAAAGDAFSAWIINTAAGGHFSTRVAAVFGTALATGPLGAAIVFIGSLLAIMASFAQVITMVARNGVLILTAAASPVAAAAAIYKGSEDMWRKLWMWQLAFVLYKPVAAFVYAAAFVTVGDGKSATDELSGLALMIMSVLALPALLRLMMPVSARISSGGGAGALAGAAVAASGAATVLSTRGRSGGGGGGGSGAMPAGPSGASGTSSPPGGTGAGPPGGAAGGGAVGGGAATGAGAGVALAAGAQAIGQATKAAKGAANTATGAGEPG